MAPPQPVEASMDSLTSSESWSELNDARRRIRERWPTIWKLRVVPRAMGHAAARIAAGAVVLDIGAGDGRFGRKLAQGATYRVLDTDPRVRADHRSLDEVADASIDAIACFEMIEHVTLAEAAALAAGCARVLRPGGRLFVSTPNIHHPWSYLRSATHRTPFCYDELGGLLELAGLRVEEMLRCHRDAPLKAMARRLAYPLHRLLGVDYAKGILAVARRPDDSTRPEM